MNLRQPVPPFRLPGYGTSHESAELPSEEDQRTHCFTATSSRFAMISIWPPTKKKGDEVGEVVKGALSANDHDAFAFPDAPHARCHLTRFTS